MPSKAQATKRAARANFLTTFAAPRPRRWLIAALVPVNRVLCLGGIPGLRRLPLLGRVPGIRGLADVVRMDLPPDAKARLKSGVNGQTAAFVVPNHPEFFTDWMLDKELCTRVAPMTANWATHAVVNGMGRTMQRFWLANNLIAQIPGSNGQAGKDYSVCWAAQGHAVLLHPEGQVGWHNDYVGPLFPGVVEMALATVEQLAEENVRREVFIAPVVWKLKFVRDEAARLIREMSYVEAALGLRVDQRFGLGERLHEAYATLLQRDATKWHASISLSEPYWRAQARLLEKLAAHLNQLVVGLGGALPEPPAQMPGLQVSPSEQASQAYRVQLAHADRLLRSLDDAETDAARLLRELIGDMRRILRVRPEMYPRATLTQEQIAENIKRLRNDYCFGSLRDNVNRFIPRPAGSRIAYVRVPQPLNITQAAQTAQQSPAIVEELLAQLRERMQQALDGINDELHARGAFIEYPNPFVS